MPKPQLPFWSSPPRSGKDPNGEPAIIVDVAPSRSERRSSRCTTVYLTESEAAEAVKARKKVSLVLAVKVLNAGKALLAPSVPPADAEVVTP